MARYGVSVSGPQQTSALAAVGAKTAPCSLTLFSYDQVWVTPNGQQRVDIHLGFRDREIFHYFEADIHLPGLKSSATPL